MTNGKKSTLEEYLAKGQIKKELYDAIQEIPNEEKKERVIDTLHRRIAKRGVLP